MIKLLKLKWPGVFTGHRRQDEVMMNWRFRQPRLGDRVAKAFDGVLFHGEVVKYFQADEDDGENAHVLSCSLGRRCCYRPHCPLPSSPSSSLSFSFCLLLPCLFLVLVVFAISFACYQ